MIDLANVLSLCRKSLFDDAINVLRTSLPKNLFEVTKSSSISNEKKTSEYQSNSFESDNNEIGIDLTNIVIDGDSANEKKPKELSYKDFDVDPLDLCSYLLLLCIILYWQGLTENDSNRQLELLTSPIPPKEEKKDPILQEILENVNQEDAAKSDNSIVNSSNNEEFREIVSKIRANVNNPEVEKENEDNIKFTEIHFNLVYSILSKILDELINESTAVVPPSPINKLSSSQEIPNYFLRNIRLALSLLEADRFSASILSKFWRKNLLFYESFVSPMIGFSLHTVFSFWPESLNESTYSSCIELIYGTQLGSISHLFCRVVLAEMPNRKRIYDLLKQYEFISKTMETYEIENQSLIRSLLTRRAYLQLALRNYKESKLLFDDILSIKDNDLWSCLAFIGLANMLSREVAIDGTNNPLKPLEREDNQITCMFLFEESLQRYRQLSISDKKCPAGHIELFCILSYCEVMFELESLERLHELCSWYLQRWNDIIKTNDLISYGELIPGILLRYIARCLILRNNPNLPKPNEELTKAENLIRGKIEAFRSVLGPVNLSVAELMLSLSEDCVAYRYHYLLRHPGRGYRSGNDSFDILGGIHSEVDMEDLAILSEVDINFREVVLLAEDTVKIYRLIFEKTGNEAHLHGASRSFQLLARLYILSQHPQRMNLSKGYIEKAMDIYREMGGIGICFDLANIQSNLGRILCGNNESQEAIGLFDQSLDILRQLFGDHHIIIAQTNYLKAQAMQDIGVHEDAEPFVLEALSIYRNIFTKEENNDNVVDIADCLVSQGLIHQELDEWEEAKELYTKALEVYSKAIDKSNMEKDIRIAKTLNSLGSMNQALNNVTEAKNLYESSMLLLINQRKENSMHMFIVLENLISLHKQEVMRLKYEKYNPENKIQIDILNDSIEFLQEKLDALVITLSDDIEKKEKKFNEYQEGLDKIARQKEEQKKIAEFERKKRFHEYLAAKNAEKWKNSKCLVM